MAERRVFAGPAVRKVRREAGMTQAAMAEALDISPSYLNLIEHGQRPLSRHGDRQAGRALRFRCRDTGRRRGAGRGGGAAAAIVRRALCRSGDRRAGGRGVAGDRADDRCGLCAAVRCGARSGRDFTGRSARSCRGAPRDREMAQPFRRSGCEGRGTGRRIAAGGRRSLWHDFGAFAHAAPAGHPHPADAM